MKALDSFIHTNKEIHGPETIDEFLIPDIFNMEPKLLGMNSGKEYEYGLLVGTHRLWDENVLFDLAQKIKTIDPLSRVEKTALLKNYIEQIKHIRQNFPDSIVIIDESMNLVRTKSRKEFLAEKSKLKPLSKKKKDAYTTLAKLCLNNNLQNTFSSFITKIKDYEGHYEYYSTLNYVMRFLDENEFHFIMALDWKADIKDLIWRVNSCLRQNFDLNIELPEPNNYPSDASISYGTIISDFRKTLNLKAFELGLIDTEGDEYVILIHKTEDTAEIAKAVDAIGYRYINN